MNEKSPQAWSSEIIRTMLGGDAVEGSAFVGVAAKLSARPANTMRRNVSDLLIGLAQALLGTWLSATTQQTSSSNKQRGTGRLRHRRAAQGCFTKMGAPEVIIGLVYVQVAVAIGR